MSIDLVTFNLDDPTSTIFHMCNNYDNNEDYTTVAYYICRERNASNSAIMKKVLKLIIAI